MHIAMKGGIKAVVWTDAVQTIILLVGLIALAVIGSIRVGGGEAVWTIAMDTGRINYNELVYIVPSSCVGLYWSETRAFNSYSAMGRHPPPPMSKIIFILKQNIKRIRIITVEYKKNMPEGCQRSKRSLNWPTIFLYN